jgi:hypothetical protein
MWARAVLATTSPCPWRSPMVRSRRFVSTAAEPEPSASGSLLLRSRRAVDTVDEDLARLGVLLVEERVLRRLIKQHRRIRGVGLQVPHEKCYTLRRAELEPLLDRGDTAVELARLPDRVILISGDRARMLAASPDAMSEAWRRIFHARVHQAFDDLLAEKALTAAAIRERVNRVGQTEFDEIRSVLKQEDLLLPPIERQRRPGAAPDGTADGAGAASARGMEEASIYIEFVALYLELQQFAPVAVERTFPAVFDTAHVDATIALDLDVRAILAASRPSRAPEAPVIAAVEVEDPYATTARLERADPSAKKAAAAARKRGNRSRAAMMSARAGDMVAAKADLEELAARLARAVGAPSSAGWADALMPVAHFAATASSLRFDAGARLLHDLQSACVVAEREDKVVDVIGWALSRGKRRIVRPLPATREVRVAKHVHAASAKVAACGLEHPADREKLAEVVHEIVRRADDHLRTAMKPKVERALDDVGLEPYSLPERVAEKKLVDEMLDTAVNVGRLSLGDLRDAISRNDLKMPDLDREELKHGDRLLRCDKILSESLDGVYRRGEAYLRFLQKVSSVLFGTRVGRFLTLYLMLPLLGSFAVLQGLQHMVHPVAHKFFHAEVTIYTTASLLAGAAFLFLLLHVKLFRRGVVLLLRGVWRVTRLVLFDAPLALWRLPIVRRFFASWFNRYIVKPAIPAAITLLFFDGITRWIVAGSVYAVFAVMLNIRLGRLVEEMIGDWIVRSGRQVTSRILPGLVRYTLAFFAKLIDLLDRGIYRVDEWLRFRSGQSVIKLAVKGLLGTIWFLVTYILRLYVNLFVEPTTNPIKHFPVVTVAAKIILPFTPAILEGVSGPASSLMGSAMGNSFAAFTVLVLPGLAGFLVWELKENWKLYRATRSKVLKPLGIGHHGETMASFLRPGFHSGTIPKIYTRLRRAAWKGDERGVARQKEALHHVEEAIERFVDRQLVSMLNEVAAFRATDVAVHHVEIGSNRVQISLACPTVGPNPVVIRFEQQSGWIVASLADAGWSGALDERQRDIFEIAIAGFYKLSGVDILREQVEDVLRRGGTVTPAYDIADEGLVVWPGNRFEIEVVYDLRSAKLRPTVRGGPDDAEPLDLAGYHALFGREPLYWAVWSTTWRQIQRGEEPQRIIVGPSLLRPELAAAAA